MNAAAEVHASNARMVRKLVVVVIAMFGFGYALVPLYDVFCDITGFGSKTGVVQAHTLDGVVDENRYVTVEFVTTVNSGLPWEFRARQKKVRVHPGKVYEASFYVRNRANETVVGQAIPSVAPGVASQHFKKTECFCFTRQTFAPGEGREMPVRFVVDKELPTEISTLTLGYTFFGVDEKT